MSDQRREHRVDAEHHGKNSGRRAAAPAESVEQGDVKNTERRMDAAGETENNEGQRQQTKV